MSKKFNPSHTTAIPARIAIVRNSGNSKNSTPRPSKVDFTNAQSHYPQIDQSPLEKFSSGSDLDSLTSEEWLNSEQAARYLKISVGSLRNMTSNGQIPHCKLGNRNRYRVKDLRELLLSKKRGINYGI